MPTSERLHWLLTPRNNVLQSGLVHSDLTEEPAAELERLFATHVGM